jgi:AcrR family transcriptional regulator
VPRPRTVDDGTIFAATATVMSREGPAKLTLGRIGTEAGLSASTLVQRFGSKTGLLRAMSKASKGETSEFVASLRRRFRSPVTRVREFVLCFAGLAPSAEALINNTLVYLQVDLADPVMRRQLQQLQRDQEKALAALVKEAIETGELIPTVNPTDLARALPRLATGSLLAWALDRTGTARECLARDVDAVLKGFRRRPA